MIARSQSGGLASTIIVRLNEKAVAQPGGGLFLIYGPIAFPSYC
jgi:hypothetical protein